MEHTANSNERDVNRNPGIGGENISHVTLGTAAIFFHIPVLSPFQAVSMMSRPLYDEDGMCPSLDSHKQRNLGIEGDVVSCLPVSRFQPSLRYVISLEAERQHGTSIMDLDNEWTVNGLSGRTSCLFSIILQLVLQ